MAITTVDGWFAAQRQRIRMFKSTSVTSLAGTLTVLQASAGYPGALGGTAVSALFDDTAPAAVPIDDFPVGATGYIAGVRFRNSVAGAGFLYDRFAEALVSIPVSAAGGPTQTAITVATPLARCPGGSSTNETVMYIRVATGVTGGGIVTAVVNYTRQDGTAGQTSQTVTIGATSAGAMYLFGVAQSTLGINSIQSVTIVTSAAVTVAGAVVIGIARPLAWCDVRVAHGTDAQGWDMTGGVQVFQNSSLWMVVQPDSTTSGLPSMEVIIVSG